MNWYHMLTMHIRITKVYLSEQKCLQEIEDNKKKQEKEKEEIEWKASDTLQYYFSISRSKD